MPAVASSVRPPARRAGLIRLAENLTLPVVEGANQMVRSVTQPVSRAMDYFPQNADTSPMPTDQPKQSVWDRVKNVLLEDPEKQKARAMVNARRHAATLLPYASRIKSEADKITAIADDNSTRINPHLNGVQKTAAKVMGMAPEMFLSGPKKGVIVANRVLSAAKDFGEHQNIPGAAAELIIPKNTVAGNIAANFLTDALATARRKFFK